MQMLVRATADSLFLVGKKAVGMGIVFAGFLLAPLQGHVQSMSPEEQSIWLMYFSDLEQINLIDQLCRARAQGDAQERILDALEDHRDCLERTPLDLIPRSSGWRMAESH